MQHKAILKPSSTVQNCNIKIIGAPHKYKMLHITLKNKNLNYQDIVLAPKSFLSKKSFL